MCYSGWKNYLHYWLIILSLSFSFSFFLFFQRLYAAVMLLSPTEFDSVLRILLRDENTVCETWFPNLVCLFGISRVYGTTEKDFKKRRQCKKLVYFLWLEYFWGENCFKKFIIWSVLITHYIDLVTHQGTKYCIESNISVKIGNFDDSLPT